MAAHDGLGESELQAVVDGIPIAHILLSRRANRKLIALPLDPVLRRKYTHDALKQLSAASYSVLIGGEDAENRPNYRSWRLSSAC